MLNKASHKINGQVRRYADVLNKTLKLNLSEEEQSRPSQETQNRDLVELVFVSKDLDRCYTDKSGKKCQERIFKDCKITSYRELSLFLHDCLSSNVPGSIYVNNRLFELSPTGFEERKYPVQTERLPGLNKVWDQGLTGKGQRVFLIDSGVYDKHPELDEGKVVGWKDFTFDHSRKPSDEYGHGTKMAGLIAGDGDATQGFLKGVAPEAEVYAAKITNVREAIKALDWAVANKEKLGSRVINMSLGEKAVFGHEKDAWSLATKRAIDAGFIVVAAAGNSGPEAETIETPGITPGAITVGAYDNNGTFDDYTDDSVAGFQSRGKTIDGLDSPDVLAPGVSIYGPNAPGSILEKRFPKAVDGLLISLPGTSQATALVSGLVLLMLQVNPDLTSVQVESILKETAKDTLGADPNDGGAGLVQADLAIEMAKGYLETGNTAIANDETQEAFIAS